MSILTNVVARETKDALDATQSAIATSIRRLSTGLRINSAQDDPAGLAIASRMQSQLSGLEQAKANTNQGISMLQTADGGLAGSTKLLQAMRGLAVEAANGTNSQTDLASIQAEITQLQANIQQIATTTQYNGINLLDGKLSNLQFQVGANAGQTISIGLGSAQETDLGNQLISLTGTAAAAISNVGTAATAGSALNNVQAQTLTIQGNGSTQSFAIGANATAQAIAASINNKTNLTGVTASASATATMGFAQAGTQSFTLNGQQISASWASASDYGNVVNAINQQTGITGVTATLNGTNITLQNSTGADISVANTSAISGNSISLAGTYNSGTAQAPNIVAGTPATLTDTTTAAGTAAAKVGGSLTFSSQTGFSMTSDTVGALFQATTPNGSQLNTVGSINVTTLAGANLALGIIDAAIAQINTQRGLVGALQNRFTAAVEGLETSALNLTASLSTERDVDFAGETTNLATEQILQQAATAMLAQANQVNSGVLALLRG